MTTPVTSDVFLSTYKDDFRDSDNYHRVLFRPGRAVQARELTQLQTIIQREITRVGNYLFKEGAIINASGASLASNDTAINYIILASEPAQFADLVGRIVTKSGTSVAARVKKVLTSAQAAAITSTAVTAGPTLLIEYLDGSGSTSDSKFAASNVLTVSAGWAGSGTLSIRSTGNDVGRGTLIEMPVLNMYATGRFVFAEGQSLVVDPYSASPTAIVGYKVEEQIVTVSDDVRLYDNSGANYNFTSPGADRYRIKLTLALKSQMSSSDSFIDVLKIDNGVVTAVVTEDNQLNRLGDLLATRTKDITGNFIVRSGSGTFACEIGEDSDAGFYQINISPGTAFVGGYRIEKNQYTTLRVEKPRDVTDDVLTVTNEVVPFTLGNYYLVDSFGGGLINKIGTSSPYIDLLDSTGDSIGIAAIIQAEKVYDASEPGFDYKVYINDITLDSAAGQVLNIRDVRKLGIPNNKAIVAPIKQINGGYGLQDRKTNTLLVPLGTQRVKSLTDISADVAKVSSLLTANGSGQVTITDPDGETLTNPEDWFAVNTTDAVGGRTVPSLTLISALGTSVTVGGLTSSKAYYVYYYARRTYGSFGAAYNTASSGPHSVNANGEVFFATTTNLFHVAKINSVTDATTNEDVTYKFIFVSGQRDTRFDPPKLVLKAGYTQTNTVNVAFDYYNGTVANKNVRVAQSYSGIDYSLIPSYRNAFGVTYNLSDVIDMRPIKTTANAYSNYSGLPKNNSLIEINSAVYWQPRIDRVYLSPDGLFRVAKGLTSTIEQYPEIPAEAMLLCDIHINPYMKNKKDHRLSRSNNTGYKMSNIRELEKRISNLEEITTLTMSELAIKDLSVQDEDGIDRYKLGLTIDKFELNSQAALGNLEYRALLDKQYGAVRPMTVIRDLNLVYDSAASSNTRRYGPLVLPVFSEVEYLSQTSVSETINVNQFSLAKYIGSGTLTPSTDTWTRSAKVTNAEGDAEVTRIASQGNQLEGIDPYWKRLGYASYQAFITDRL